MQRLLLIGLLLAFLSACQQMTAYRAVTLESPSEAAIEYLPIAKSPTDERDYRLLKLPNDMLLLLVSDPEATQAAAALDINIGSRQDPKKYQGLAHFLEHMLFLGTAAYPEAGEYQRFISANGGHTNAYTALEHTNYFFDVNAAQLEQALDRFAQFFVAPLFNAEYVSREVNAVHSEYRARIKNDRRRYYDAMREIIDPWHPQSNFTVGSLETLLKNGEEPLRQALLSFYQRYYSANIMRAVVSGPQSLQELEAIAAKRFSAVPNRNVVLKPIEGPLFAPSRIPHWVNIKPLQEDRSITLHFPVPEVRSHWRSKPLSYIGNILGHEGRGSLLSYLKAKGWADSLSAGTGYEFQGGATFAVSIGLTPAGNAARDEVVEAVFQMIALMREQSVSEWRFREQGMLGDQAFQFRAKGEPINEVSSYASALNNIPDSSEALRGQYLMSDYKYQLLVDYISYLVPRNVIIAHAAPEVYTDKLSRYYQTPYGERRISPGLLKRWGVASPDQAMAMPQKNRFVAEQFQLKVSEVSELPQRLDSANGLRLWFKHDDEFDTPKGRVDLLLEQPMAANTPQHQAYTQMWLAMVEDQLNEFAYPAALAGLQYDIYSSWRGIHLSIGGFDQRQSVLLEQILKVLKNPSWDWKRFQRLHKERERALSNRALREPFRRLGARLFETLSHNSWPLEAQQQAHAKATQFLVRRHAEQLMSASSASMLVYGNFTAFDAQQMAQLVLAELSIGAEDEAVEERVQIIPVGDTVSVLDGDYDDTALSLYLQAPKADKPTRAVLGIAAQMIKSDFYLKLRTEKQLGYIVGASPLPIRDSSGLQFVVQSPVADAEQLRKEFDGFIQDWFADVREAEFLKHREALVQLLREEPQNLWDRGQRYWRDVLDGETSFDGREQLVKAIADVDYAQWQEVMEETLSRETRRALWVVHWGKAGQKPFEGAASGTLNRDDYYAFP